MKTSTEAEHAEEPGSGSAFYFAQAEEARRLAAAETLATRRDVHLIAAARWIKLADQMVRVERCAAERIARALNGPSDLSV